MSLKNIKIVFYINILKSLKNTKLGKFIPALTFMGLELVISGEQNQNLTKSIFSFYKMWGWSKGYSLLQHNRLFNNRLLTIPDTRIHSSHRITIITHRCRHITITFHVPLTFTSHVNILFLLPYGPNFMWFLHLQLEGMYYDMWCNIENIVFSYIYLSCPVRYTVTIVCCPNYIYRKDGYKLYMPFNQLQFMLQLSIFFLFIKCGVGEEGFLFYFKN